MYENLFTDFKDDSRIWIYGFNRKLNPDESNIVIKQLDEFVKNWKSHGDEVNGSFELVHQQIIVLCASQDTKVSGCSIDSSIRIFKDFQVKHGLNALNFNLLYYRDQNEIKTISRDQLSHLALKNAIDSNTIVFDMTLQNLGDLRSGKFEIRMRDSWHKNIFLKVA